MVTQKALHHVKPSFELRKARIGGSTQFIPAALPLHKQENKAIRTLISNALIKQKKFLIRKNIMICILLHIF